MRGRMMSGRMSTRTSPPFTPDARALQRAEWFDDLSQPEREALFELTLPEVDDRFAAWLASAGRDGGTRA